MSILVKGLIKLILASLITVGGFSAGVTLAVYYNDLFILLAILAIMGGAVYTYSIRCPNCGAPMFSRTFFGGLFVIPWISPECYECDKNLLEKDTSKKNKKIKQN